VTRLLTSLRGLLHGSDKSRAIDDEQRVLAAHGARAEALERKLRASFSADASGANAIPIGTAVEERWPVRLTADRLKAHTLVVGPSGCGKSRLAVLILKGLLEAGIGSLVVLDPKAETVELMKAAYAVQARRLRGARRREFLRRVISIDLFGTETLPRLNVLSPVPGLDPELQAYEVALLLTAELDQGVGVRQEAILHRAIECLMRAGLPITVLPTVLEAPVVLERLAETVGHAELFRTTAGRLKRESKERILGLVSRAERVLRLKATRLALGAPDCIDFGELLDSQALVNLASPHGAADISKVLSGLLWLGVSHAIRRRPNGAPRSHLVIDEFPTFLAAGGARMAEAVEDLLRLARSKGVFLTALTQDLASIAKVASTLPETLRTNTHLFALFRCLADGHWDFVLPVTGRRPRPKPAPWEAERGGFLDRSAELALLRGTLSKLPDRELFLTDRRTGLPGLRLRTADLVLDATKEEIEQVEREASRHPMLASVAELERARDEVARRVASLLNVQESALPADERAPIRRARAKLDIG
jgi:energy-coupling factor transporter ATP-binding protein EcfA2